MAITLNGTTGISSPGGDTSTSLATTNLSYTGTLTGGTGVIAIGTNQIYKDASGNVGIGTASPAAGVRLNISDVKAKIQVTSTTGTNAGYITFSNTGGNVYYGIDNSAGTDFSAAYAGVMWNGGAYPLVFGTSNVEKMRLDASGNLGIGTSSVTANHRFTLKAPTANYCQMSLIGGDTSNYCTLGTLNDSNVFFISQNGTERARIDSSGNLLVGCTSINPLGSTRLVLSENSGTTKWAVGPLDIAVNNFYVYAATGGGVVLLGTSATSWSSNSDERLKTDLKPIENAAQKVSTLRAVTGRYKTDVEGFSRAFLIAQDVQKVLPEAVGYTKLVGADDETDYLALAYTDTIPLLVAAIKELTTRLAKLEAQ